MKKLEQHDLDSIISRLTGTYVIDQIFLWTFKWEAQTCHMLQILMQKGGGQYFTDANIYMGSVVKEYDNIDFVICYPHEIRKKIKQGLGRVILICQPENLVYENPEPKDTISTPALDLDALLGKTKSYVEKEFGKIQSFIEGYQFYFNKEIYSHAAFMLHQVIELAFRTAEHLITGDERRTHCLKTHQNYLAKFTHELGSLFHTPKRRQVIDKLDDAYSAIRYDQDYKIKKKQLESAHQVAEMMLEWLTDYNAFLLQELKEKLSPKYKISINSINNTNMNTSINTDHRDLILNALETYCTLTTVRCFAYRTRSIGMVNLIDAVQQHQEKHHYYLMIVYTVTDAAAQNIQNAAKNLLPEYLDITILPFEHAHFQKQCNQQSTFHVALFRQSEVWFENQEKVIELPQDGHVVSFDKRYQRIDWMRVHQRADHLYNTHVDNLFSAPEEVACYGLALALEQACLGLIRMFWQFQPQSTNLNHLMQLCEIICPEATSVFVLDHPSQCEIFKLLVDAQQQFRHNPNYQTDGHYLEILADRVREFIDVTHKTVEGYLVEETNTTKQTDSDQEHTTKDEICA